MKTKVALECVRMIVSGGKMVKLMTHQETHTHTHTPAQKKSKKISFLLKGNVLLELDLKRYR